VPPASKETVDNLSGKLLDHTTYAALCPCLNCAVALAVLPEEDILIGVEKAVRSLHLDVAEETRKETVRKLWDSSRRMVNVTVTERMVLIVLQKNNDRIILLADKGNATVVLNAVDYNDKIGALVQDPSYRRLVKTPQRHLNAKHHFCLRSLHLQRWFAGNYIPWAEDH